MKPLVVLGFWPFVVIVGVGLVVVFALRNRPRRQLALVAFWTVLLFLVWWTLYSFATNDNVLAWVYAVLGACLILWRKWLTDRFVALERPRGQR